MRPSIHESGAVGGAGCSVLFLAHRIPFPPDKGDKIRSYHLLRHLAGRYRVCLGAFVDDPSDLQYEAPLRTLCQEVRLFPIRPRARRLASLSALLGDGPLSVRYYRDRRMSRWIESVRQRGRPNAVVTCSSTMARFVAGREWSGVARIADFVDVDSEKWRQYAESAPLPLSWLYAREARALLAYERRIATSFSRTLFVSQSEAALFAARVPEAAQRVGYLSNGVDADYFDPARPFPDPYPAGGPVIVFTGAMDYRPNVEAVTWFAETILPRIARQRPDARFWIVGNRPSRVVFELGKREGVTVTGRVPDVRPYLGHASVVVAPLRIARGLQNKVLEALAMARPVVCTTAAAEGIDPEGRRVAAIEDDAEPFAAATLRAMQSGARADGRRFVLEKFSWERNLSALGTMIGVPSDHEQPVLCSDAEAQPCQ